MSIVPNQETIKVFLDNAPENIVLLSKEHKVLAFNKMAAYYIQLFFNIEMNIGDDYRAYNLPTLEHHYYHGMELALNQFEIYSIDLEVNKGELYRWFNYSIHPVFDSNNELFGACITAKDITDKKLAELALLNQNEELKQIAWKQSHEVRAPLKSIQGLINIISKEKKYDKESFSLLEKSVNELDNVLSEIVRYIESQEL